MFGYYLDLALRSLKRNKVLTTLMVLALGLGIGASITTLTVLKLLSGDPLPGKSARIFTPTFDMGASAGEKSPASMPQWWGDLLSYRDAMALLDARKAKRQAVVALTQLKVAPHDAGIHPFHANAVMTTPGFFPMLDVPFAYGSSWSVADGQNRARVAVISSEFNARLFGGKDSVGQVIRLDDHDYRVVGVLKPWSVDPRFYGISVGAKGYGLYGKPEAVFLPVQTGAADQMSPGQLSCWSNAADMRHLENAPCVWVSLWVELAHASDATAYKAFLTHYVQQQISLGRMHDPKVWLYSLMDFLDWQQVVPSDVALRTNLAFAFLAICILNTVGLLLAKCLRRSREIGVRRALGATRRSIFAQFLVESAIVGLAGGVLGLVFAELGLWAVRHQPVHYAALAHLDVSMFVTTFVLAVIASLIAGVLPAWRASLIAPASQLKST